VSVVQPLGLNAQYRTAAIVAIGLIMSVLGFWSVVAILARRGMPTPAFAGNAQVGHLALALGVIVVVVAGMMRRAALTQPVAQPAVRLLTASIIACALAEFPGVLGLVAYVLTGLPGAAYPLFVLALAALVFYFPRRGQWEEWAKVP